MSNFGGAVQLSQNHTKLLDEIEFKWDPHDKKFEKGFQETLIYKKQTGNPNAPQIYKSNEGFPLGTWQMHQRNYYKKGTISAERIKLLEKIGFKWDIHIKHLGKNGFQETLIYKERTGNANAPVIYKTSEGFPLGTWQMSQRNYYQKGKLSAARIKQLEKIGFRWSAFEELFEKGFHETLIYKERTGNPNAPQHYKTSEGFPLGRWQGSKREHYKKGKLSTDRIKRLEEIGFKWALKKG